MAVTPAVANSPPPQVIPRKEVARAGPIRADFFYAERVWGAGLHDFTNLRIRISRGREQLFSEAVPPHPRDKTHAAQPAGWGYKRSVAIRDLDGDGDAEVILELFWGGAHCCFWSRIYRFGVAHSTYAPVNHFWGNSRHRLQDLNDDGRPEFVSSDDRFAYAFTDYASSVEPIQLWSYDHGEFREITRSYPRRIARDAAQLWRLYLSHRGTRSVRGILAAWAADQYMLGRSRTVDQALAQALRRDELASTGFSDWPTSPRAYVRELKKFLKRTGYISG